MQGSRLRDMEEEKANTVPPKRSQAPLGFSVPGPSPAPTPGSPVVGDKNLPMALALSFRPCRRLSRSPGVAPQCPAAGLDA